MLNAQFLQVDTGYEKNRILIFATKENLKWLECDIWAANGTFDSVPSLFCQLYNIHPLRDETAIPAIFGLLSNKTEDTYTRFLREVSKLMPNFSLRIIMTDFEKAALNAFSNVYPDAVQRGCFFHFSQCLWRKV